MEQTHSYLSDPQWKQRLHQLMVAPGRESFYIKAADGSFYTDKKTFEQKLARFMDALSDMGRVMIVEGNSDQWIILALACLISGKELFALDAKMDEAKVNEMIEQIRPDCVITQKNVVNAYGPVMNFDGLNSRQAVGEPIERESKLVLFTTGTTGTPKGVEMTLVNIMTGTESFQRRFQVQPEEMTLVHAPLSHTMGFMVMMVNICYGKGAIMALNEMQILHTILNEKIHWTVIPPVLANVFMGRPEFMNKLKDYRAIFSSGAGLSRDVYTHFEENGVHLINGYGMTESVTVMAVTAPGQRPWETTPLDWCKIKISDQNEILASGPVFAQRYYGGGPILDAEGWYHTGDMGTYEDGCLVVTARMDNVCVLDNGFKINLEDLENRIIALEQVLDCRVFMRKLDGHIKLGVQIVPVEACKHMSGEDFKEAVRSVTYYYEQISYFTVSDQVLTKGGKKVRHE